MPELHQTPPLGDCSPSVLPNSQVSLSSPPTPTLIRLRAHMEAANSIQESLPELLPRQALCTTRGDPGALWLAPDSWLLVSHRLSAIKLQQLVADRLTDQLYATTNLSDALTLLRLEGSGAGQVLAAGCGLNFAADAFPAGHCSRTRFAHLPLMIHKPDEAERFELYVDRSYAAALWNWLLR